MIIAAAKDAILVQIGVLYKRKFVYLNDYGSLLLYHKNPLWWDVDVIFKLESFIVIHAIWHEYNSSITISLDFQDIYRMTVCYFVLYLPSTATGVGKIYLST
jgi:hypothetical protein